MPSFHIKEAGMESKNANRTIWIVLAIVLALACGCLCIAAIGGAGLFLITQPEAQPFEFGGLRQERIARSFDVGDEPVLGVDSFAGSVTVYAGEEGVIEVVAIKRAASSQHLAEVSIEMNQRANGLSVRTTGPRTRTRSNVSVDFEITAPPDARLEVRTAAGNVDVRGIQGGIRVHSGAGNIDVRAVSGAARLDVGAGDVRYEGQPAGACSFETGAGNIRLRVPADIDAQVDLSTGVGKVSVDWEVKGRVSPRHVEGTVGEGGQADIQAHTGVGNVTLERR
jgi:DUF4097 and DUF4098 domain-containing protein YvlB